MEKAMTDKPEGPTSGSRPIRMTELVETAREEIRQLTGLKLSSTVETARTNEGWRISVEMVEKESLPDAMDVLATYELSVDEGGHVLEFKRRELRKRIETDKIGQESAA